MKASMPAAKYCGFTISTAPAPPGSHRLLVRVDPCRAYHGRGRSSGTAGVPSDATG